MRIGFDVSQTGRLKAGCGYFADSLIRSLAQVDTANEYILYPTFGTTFWDSEWSATAQINQPNFRRGLAQRTFEEMQRFWMNPPDDFELQLDRPDIVHANNYFCPLGLRAARIVYTLYDLGFIQVPEYTTEANRIACFEGVYRASLYADRIIAISDYSRRHFLDTFPHYPAERISVVYPASRLQHHNGVTRPKQLTQLQPEQFWLTVGTLEPRKNHQRLLQAYARLKARLGQTYPLVLAGGKGWLMEGFNQTVAELGLERDVIFLGYIDDLTLQWLYQHCFAFVYPSLFEGFGLPVLEAMCLGSAVITSHVTSLPEIVGQAGILIDPQQEEQIYAAMLNLVEEGSIRENLRLQALERARFFSWENAASQVKAVYLDAKAQAQKPRPFTQSLPDPLRNVSSSWERFGRDDPLWAVLTWPEKKGGKWAPEEFFSIGRQDVEALLKYLGALGIKLNMGKALDFGCGAGRLTQALAEHFEEAHGVDISMSMITTANKLNRNPLTCIFHLNKADDLQIFDENTFDFVLTLITLQHIPRPYALKYIAEFARVLKPGGVMVFQVPASRRDAQGNPLPSPASEQAQDRSKTNDSVMIMSGIPYPEVVRTLTESGARLVDAVEEMSAGPEWLSYRYCAVKQG